MVVCHLHIISLKAGVSIAGFLAQLGENGVKPVFKARVLRWMILPTRMSAGHLLGRNTHWDILLGLEDGATIPASSQADMASIWTASCGVSANALSSYSDVNATLFNQASALSRGSVQLPAPSDGGDTSQNLELSSEWVQWIAALPGPVREHPVSMLNLLAFHPGKKDQYKKYGAEFSRRVGSRHGGHVKVVGRVLEGQAKRDGWDEIAWVHYPTITHFAAMSASRDYQDVNREYRLGALKDTFILCCQELDDHGELAASKPGSSKL
ncbi:hypothetical protein N657DRAFT_683751 [Parathielavia appendiculata]|uniref:DUF1330 domain-containing protein n=1 Tax=Parathielavia appendiculata TaxID=2587402 RepID=A0AAN6TTH3_9PEZI|nr:hypothetical protein N657DRAFT_683751 [Parathielavia appendiculata]